MHFTLEDIVRQFDSATFARGERYARDGMVVDVDFVDNMITGEVEGSYQNVYKLTIYLESRRSGLVFDSDCSCPIGGDCKHVVAVLLCALQELDTAPKDGLPPVAE